MAERTDAQIKMLGTLLSTKAGREKLYKSLVPAMKKRGRVNITSLGRKLAEQVGETLAVEAERLLMDAARDSESIVIDNATRIKGEMISITGNWCVLDEELKPHEIEEGDSLTVFDPDGDIYFDRCIFFERRSQDEELLGIAFEKRWRGELIKGVRNEQDSDPTD